MLVTAILYLFLGILAATDAAVDFILGHFGIFLEIFLLIGIVGYIYGIMQDDRELVELDKKWHSRRR